MIRVRPAGGRSGRAALAVPGGSVAERRGGRPAARRRVLSSAASAPRPWRLLVAGCVALAALSLLGPAEPTYDPWAWIIWGRDITQGDLDTVEGPSWKPLPILFTTPFALLGEAAPYLWLLVARVGGLLAVAMTYRLADRLAGRWAGVIAAGSILVADEFIRNFLRGNSEGLLVAVCLWAIERHLDHRPRDAFLLGFGAALLRPEVWPFFGLYGVWLAWSHPRRRVLVATCFAATPVLWFVPEWFGSGNLLRAADRALHPNADSAAFAAVPFLEVFARSGIVLAVPVLAGAIVALVMAWRDRARPESRLALAFGAAAGVLMLAVAGMTQAGFSGNLRYVILPAALVCILAGVGWVGLLRAVRARGGPRAATAVAVALALVSVPLLVPPLGDLGHAMVRVKREADLYAAAPAVIAEAGGTRGLLSCGRLFTGPLQTQALAWRLRIHARVLDVASEERPPGTILVPRRLGPLAYDERFPIALVTDKWVVRRTCSG
jgi:hypothetical protein